LQHGKQPPRQTIFRLKAETSGPNCIAVFKDLAGSLYRRYLMRVRGSKPSALALAAVLIPLVNAPVFAKAAPQNIGMEELLAMDLEQLIEVQISISTGSPKPLRLAPSTATVVTAQDIERMGATTLNEALEAVPGLHVGEFRGANSVIYSIRGIHSSLNPQTLLLIDGIPITRAQNGARPLGFVLPASMIERIEAVRGPGSALHGADAFSGTINVITKNSSKTTGTETGGRYGSFNSSEVWGLHSGSYGDWKASAGISYMKSDGDDERIVERDLQTNLDAALNEPRGLPPASLTPGPVRSAYRNLHMQMGFTHKHWSLNLLGIKRNRQEGVGQTPVLDTYGEGKSKLFLADLTHKTDELFPDWEFTTKLSYFYDKEDDTARMFPPGALIPVGEDGNVFTAPTAALVQFTDGLFGRPIVTDHQPALSFSGVYDGFSNHRLRLGAGIKYFEMKTDNYKNFGPGVLDTSEFDPPPAVNTVDGKMTHLSSDSPYIFMNNHYRTAWHSLFQDEWAFAKGWEFTAGARYDHYSDFGGTFNPRLALVWEPRSDLRTKLLYGRAFRPPSFAEQHQKNNPSALGNPDLKPETINTYEWVVDCRPTKRIHTSMSLFYYKIQDLIDRVPDDGASTITAQNARDQNGRGLEFEAQWQIGKAFRLAGNMAYQYAKDEETNNPVPDAPKLQFYVNPQWELSPEWSLDGQYFWVGRRPRADGDGRDEINVYRLTNLTLHGKNIAKYFGVTLAVRNLLDRDVREPAEAKLPYDLPMEGRSFWGETTINF